MARRRPALGGCPDCGATIPQSQLGVRYERDGRPTILAECPSCGAVVTPE